MTPTDFATQWTFEGAPGRAQLRAGYERHEKSGYRGVLRDQGGIVHEYCNHVHTIASRRWVPAGGLTTANVSARCCAEFRLERFGRGESS